MPVEIKIELKNTATAGAEEVRKALKPGVLENAMARGVSNRVQSHLFQYNAEHPNKLGGRRTNFYARAGRSTSHSARPGGFTITINQIGFEQRLKGGWIRPTAGRKYLTIPAVPEAHGRRASEFNNLRFGFTENKYGNLQPALVEASATRLKFGRQRKDGSRGVKAEGSGGRAIFFLSKRVFQPADPSVLPTVEELQLAAQRAADDHLNAAIARAEAKGGSNA